MRNPYFAIPLAALAAPVAAAPQPPVAPVAPLEIPSQLTDPATAEKLGDMLQAMSHAFLDLKVGEVRAAAEGRAATPAEKQMTVRDMASRDDPNFDRDFDQKIAQAKPMIQQSMKAFAQALPAITRSLSDVASQVERAVQNMPRADYPRR